LAGKAEHFLEEDRSLQEGVDYLADVDVTFKGVSKRDTLVQGLLLKWQEKVLSLAKTFANTLHQAWTAEEQQKQLGEMHQKSYTGWKDSANQDRL